MGRVAAVWVDILLGVRRFGVGPDVDLVVLDADKCVQKWGALHRGFHGEFNGGM